ncbi:LuxR C-terminal-related transcriptional regulator [Actinoplanes sp. NBC_00393]|uniref:ATP-binding protein n=1 Tax=Actinoplanes sp. NBC_00393 TaxID=2975953 RepID=UPI002E1A6C48
MLLERSEQLHALHAAADSVRTGPGGALVLLGGEAGGGKTALLRRFRAESDAEFLWGACDPLFAPRPLGPFQEIVTGTRPHEVAAAITRDARARPGLILVLEDLHWADEATLDVLSLLGRRIEGIPALVVASYRSDELDRGHPLRRTLGELRGESVQRLRVEPLSREAVGVLAGGDGAALHRVTGGNPFFVTEVLAGAGEQVPLTVRDAVLSRIVQLDPEAVALLEAVSVAPSFMELRAVPGLDAALGAGMLEGVPGGVAFRHELARITVEESLTPHRRLELNRAVLRALLDEPDTADPSRVAHHAEAAGDAATVRIWAPIAAEQAAARGAHREAAAQYARALRFAGTLPPAERATLLERRSHECYLTEQTDESIATLRAAIRLRQQTGDRLGAGAALVALARRLWCAGLAAESARAGDTAMELLDSLPPGPELAVACSNQSATWLNLEDYAGTMTYGERALRLAAEHDVPEIVVHSLNNIGTMQLLTGEPDGIRKLERSLALAEQEGLDEHVGRAYLHVGWAMTRTRAYHLVSWLDHGLAACEELGLEAWSSYLVAYRARYLLDTGRWEAAAGDARSLLRAAGPAPLLRILALTVAGLVAARRGDEDPWVLLDEARALAEGQTELQYLAPVAAARAGAAWLAGRPVEAELRDTLEVARRWQAAAVIGELTRLLNLAGESPAGAGEMAAAEQLRARDCAYDAALVLAGAPHEAGLRAALAEFQRLGARPAAAIVTRRLRSRGLRDIPRGPQRRTRAHPADLTRREVEVLALVSEGMSNVEIAQRLFLSTKTVHHHVSAILRKLGVARRGQAARHFMGTDTDFPGRPAS